jgi:chromosome segregation ATPase
LDALAHEIELVRRASERIGGLADVAQQLQAHCDSTSRDLHRAQDSLRILETERDKAKTDSAREIQRVHDLAAALEQVKQDAENERRRLALQISANATGRLDEFKNRLGFHLSRLVVDLPDKTTPVSAELGKVLLLQFHQFLDALREEGIETLSRRVGS